jgi:hypothetical protein
MRPRVVKIELPQNAKHEDVVKAVNAKLTRQTTNLLRKNQEVVLAVVLIDRAQSAAAKKTAKPR